jgi:hypothetical protein
MSYYCSDCETNFSTPKLVLRDYGVIFPQKGHAFVCPCCEGTNYIDCRVESEIDDEIACEEFFGEN